MTSLHTITTSTDFWVFFGLISFLKGVCFLQATASQTGRKTALLCGVLGLTVYFSGPHIIIYQGGVKHCHIRMMLFNTHFAPTLAATQGVGEYIMKGHMSASTLPQFEGVKKRNDKKETPKKLKPQHSTHLKSPKKPDQKKKKTN